MATTKDGRRSHRGAVLFTFTALALTQWLQVASAQDENEQSPDQAICLKMIEEMAEQVQQYCEARNLKTLQCLKFVGTHGTVSNETLEQQLIEHLKKRGIEVQKSDSTRLRGRIASQRTGTTSILLVQCTLSDISGAELQTFRLRQVVSG
ncbi:MAG: hypothetical protein AB7I48_24275 [Planctomycetaceae bacterium]